MPLNIGGNIISSTGIVGNTFKNIVATNGLVLHLDAANRNSYPGSGSAWNDLSGYGNNGTLYNSPTFNSAEASGSLSFNGSNQYAQININSTVLDGDPDFTVEMFVKRTATLAGSSGGYWGIGGAGQGYSVEGCTPTDNRIHLDLYDSTRIDSGSDYPLNTYVHVVWAKIGTAISVTTTRPYVNGILQSATLGRAQTSAPRYNTSTSGVGVAIGRLNGNSNSNYGQMNIGIFRVYNRALHPYEIVENFQAQKTRFGL